MGSWGWAYYDVTDLGQEHCSCPKCGEKAVFVRSFIPYYRINYQPVAPKKKAHYEAICRKCNQQLEYGDSQELNTYINEKLTGLIPPKILYSGAFILPIGILSLILFFLIL